MRHAEDQHAEGHGVHRQPQKLANLLRILHDVADIATAQSYRFRGDNGGLSRDHGVLGGDRKVAQSACSTRRAPRLLHELVREAAHVLKKIYPFAVIDYKDKSPIWPWR